MGRRRTSIAIAAISALAMAQGALSQTAGTGRAPPIAYAVTSGKAQNGAPAWYLRGTAWYPGGTVVSPGGKVTPLPVEPGRAGQQERDPDAVPGCKGSPVCTNPVGPPRNTMQRVTYEQTLGYSYAYPYDLPPGPGGAVAVALDSKNNLWVFQRKPRGMPQVFKFDPAGKLILTVPESVTGHAVKAHGMNVDAEDNVWILDTSLGTAKKLSPDGKLLMTIGVSGKRGDWDEAKGQRLLWEPVMIDFGANGDIYIAEGHGFESPNDTDSGNPANRLGNARVIHLDKNGKYKNQYFGNNHGPGKFYEAHGLAVDPKTGDLWIGDREEYRIIILTGDGKFVRTIQLTNLVCAIKFDSQGEPWFASGQDGQFLKINRDGKVLGAVGKGQGIGEGEFMEASYWSFDKQNNLYAGATGVGRVTKMVAPKGQ